MSELKIYGKKKMKKAKRVKKNRTMSQSEAIRRGVYTGVKSGERMTSDSFQKRHKKNLKKIEEMGYSKIEWLDD